ncbi:MAG TPA: HPr(Ser) kinase/phosphatase, partial [Xanthomonadales bacterium]|nr:HPr(Ser) kinase/phosphatase [Xanthomonadales bacterium]
MIRTVTVLDLIADLEQRLELQWVGEALKAPGPGLSASDVSSRPDLAGFLNLIHPNKVQVLGEEELDYFARQTTAERSRMMEELCDSKPLILLVGDGLDMPTGMIDSFSISQTALLRSRLPASGLVNYLQYHISRALANRTTLHGVFMEVFTIGVHIMGDSGCGKSELALELITRGHRLIADDAPEFTQISPDIIDGTCPAALQDCLEVRGLGVLNVRQMFGDAAIKLNKFLRLIVHLELPRPQEESSIRDRLRGDTSTQTVLDLDIPSITL